MELFETDSLKSDSPIYNVLAPLQLMCHRVGIDDITVNYDEKHCGKRLREAIKSPTRGMKVGRIILDVGAHTVMLHLAGCPAVKALLHPEDPMNVQAAEDLGSWLAIVKDINPEEFAQKPGMKEVWHAEQLLGDIGRCLWSIFDVDLTISQQLVNLSSLGHLLVFLTFGTGARSKFIPLQLFHDLEAVVKNAFFASAKVRLAICPDAQ
jgi:hypothetical protein